MQYKLETPFKDKISGLGIESIEILENVKESDIEVKLFNAYY